ncbi:hypothetical protein [Novosphingobium album (ex Liu et al. 2023)]|uniref:Uncharacterized protein n=1 Tax=Novosphingobium album (ex Liu et al. 2023) TaxID=3031130 RepID=A0ABT5WY06_9SPHN|nr:hypothetical protein [Novosphingobium album (ex Liu et al. 2023)]MDE8654789.1 hypothetical protein [Novosphingobium album (ex Liu et al. 2023)]
MSRPVSLGTLLDREVDALDALLSEVRGGIRGPAHFDRLEEKACAIGARLRAAFREREATRP